MPSCSTSSGNEWARAEVGVDSVPDVVIEIHGSRFVTLSEIHQTLELLRQRRLREIVSRTFPLEGAKEAHELRRKNALVGHAALLQGAWGEATRRA